MKNRQIIFELVTIKELASSLAVLGYEVWGESQRPQRSGSDLSVEEH